MKLSASLTFMFTEVAFLDRFQAARDAGFDGVEIQVLPDLPLNEIARARAAAGIEVALLNVGMGDLPDGGPGLSGVPGRRSDYAAALARALEAVRELGVHHLHIGPSRMGDIPRAACLDAYRANIADTIEAAARLTNPPLILIEPMNRCDMPDALVTDIEFAAALVREEFGDHIRLLFDIYHEAMNGNDPVSTYRKHRDIVGHVQFSNIPGRHEPGVGQLDILGLLRGLVDAGYDGWFGAEYKPSTETRLTLDWMARAVASA